MRVFQIFGNPLNGTIPTEIGLLSNLEDLNLRGGHDGFGLAGTMPSECGLLTKLIGFDVHRNELTGSLPTELGNLVCFVLLVLVLYCFGR